MRTMTHAAFVVAGALLFSPTAYAQARFEAAAGVHYGFQRPPVERDWLVSGGFRINNQLDGVVEGAWSQGEELRRIRSVTSRFLQIAAGVRGRLMAERRITPFYQGLVGVLTLSSARARDQLDVLSPWDGGGQQFLLQPGRVWTWRSSGG